MKRFQSRMARTDMMTSGIQLPVGI